MEQRISLVTLGVSDLPRARAFYQALGWFKLAVIAEGIRARHRAGQSVGTGFDDVGAAVPHLIDAGLALLT